MKKLLKTATPFVLAVVMLACGGTETPTQPGPVLTANVSGVVTTAAGLPLQGANVAIGTKSTTTDAEGKFELDSVPVGWVNIIASAPDFETRALAVQLAEGDNLHNLVLPPVDKGVWGKRANLLKNNSEYPLAEANGKLYVLGGYPPEMGPNRTSRTVQVYDIATNTWTLGPDLPQPNNHGMAASVNGKVYLIGGQFTDDQNGETAVNSVWELDPAVGTWVAKAPMPTARSGGAAVALNGKIYVAGGRVPRGNDFAVFDPVANTWDVLDPMPSQRNHLVGAAINGRIHFVGGRLGNGLSPIKSDANEIYDPVSKTWTNGAPMLRGRSGMNGVVAKGCFHVWGGEAPSGMTPDHDYYDPRFDRWWSLNSMVIPIHGVVGSAYVDGVIWVTGGGTNVGGASGSLHNQTYQPSVSCE